MEKKSGFLQSSEHKKLTVYWKTALVLGKIFTTSEWLQKISACAVTIKATLWINTCVKWFSLECHRKLKHSKTHGLSHQTRPKLSNSVNDNPLNFTIHLKSNNLLFLVNILMHYSTPESFNFAWCQRRMFRYTKYYIFIIINTS